MNDAKEEVKKTLLATYESEIDEIVLSRSEKKSDYKEKMQSLMDSCVTAWGTSFDKKQISNFINDAINIRVRALTFKLGHRVDGRKYDQLRDLTIDAGMLPRTHGSGLFQRGETQVLSIATLGPSSMEQIFIIAWRLRAKQRNLIPSMRTAAKRLRPSPLRTKSASIQSLRTYMGC